MAAGTLADPDHPTIEEFGIGSGRHFRSGSSTGHRPKGEDGQNNETSKHWPNGSHTSAAADVGPGRSRPILAIVGFDPRRKHQRTAFDYFFVAASIVVAVALLAWAVFG